VNKTDFAKEYLKNINPNQEVNFQLILDILCEYEKVKDNKKSCNVKENCRNLKLNACSTCKRLYPECSGDWYKPLK
jgi:hypothetical protein